MYTKVKQTEFGVGYINDEFIITFPGELAHEGNSLEYIVKFDTYYDDMTGLTLYGYKDKLVTRKELQREFLVDYYNVN